MKSHQKDQTCMASELNAGDKERVATRCPPDMTEAVKAALLAEIEAFRKDQKVQSEVRKDIAQSGAGSAHVDAYLDWLDNHGDQETPEANPDIVSDEDGLKFMPSKKDDETVRLLKEFRQALTRRELQVWNLIMQYQLSHRETALILRIPRRSVSVYLKRANAKFKKFMEATKRAGKD